MRFAHWFAFMGLVGIAASSAWARPARAKQETAPAPVLVQSGCEKFTCAPCIVYKGCPAPCSIEKVVRVTRPCSCCVVEVVVKVPNCGCERVRIERDGDMKLDYGKYEVEIDWKDHGRKLVIHYDD